MKQLEEKLTKVDSVCEKKTRKVVKSIMLSMWNLFGKFPI